MSAEIEWANAAYAAMPKTVDTGVYSNLVVAYYLSQISKQLEKIIRTLEEDINEHKIDVR